MREKQEMSTKQMMFASNPEPMLTKMIKHAIPSLKPSVLISNSPHTHTYHILIGKRCLYSYIHIICCYVYLIMYIYIYMLIYMSDSVWSFICVYSRNLPVIIVTPWGASHHAPDWHVIIMFNTLIHWYIGNRCICNLYIYIYMWLYNIYIYIFVYSYSLLFSLSWSESIHWYYDT